jgi:hypothetical protein
VVVVTATRLLLRRGLVVVAVAVSLTIKATVLAMVRLLGLLLPLLLRQVLVTDTVVMVTTRALVWVLPEPTVLLVTALLHLRLALLLALVLFSRRMDLPAAPRRLPRHRLVLCLHRLLRARRLLLPRLATFRHHHRHLRLRCTDVCAMVDLGWAHSQP